MNEDEKFELSLDENTPLQDLDKLLEGDCSRDLKIKIAIHKNASGVIYKKILEKGCSFYDQLDIASYASEDVLKELASEDLNNPLINTNIAGNPNTPGYILEKLIKESNISLVRSNIARHLNLPKYILAPLSQDSDDEVRLGVAKNPNTPIYILEKLAEDEDDEVRLGVATNKNATKDILKKLACDNSERIRDSVKNNINFDEDIKEIIKNTEKLNKYLE